MKCLQCSAENPQAAFFCQRCGSALLTSCPRCAAMNEPQARFCSKCGVSLAGTGIEPGLVKSLNNDKLRRSAARLEGERKPVTILFTDIVGSTTIAEKLDPEEWKEIVSASHRIVGEAVSRYEGTIAQYLGDGVLAFFGAPVTHEDDPERAVRAALEIQERLGEYRPQLRGLVDDLQLRIGLHSGLVVVGAVGDDLHMEYLAVGDSVNLAARLQSAGRPGRVLISASTAHLLGKSFELQDMGEINVKGKAELVHVYEVLRLGGMTAAQGGFSARSGGGLSSPLVGRIEELESLNAALDRLEGGIGGILFVLGEAGIGKSRLVEEARCASSAGVHWLEGHSLSYGRALSYWSIRELILDDLGLSDGDPALRRRVALRRRLEELLPDKIGALIPSMIHLLGVENQSGIGGGVKSLGGEALKYQLLQSLAAYFTALAEKQPVVLVLEDFHWADPSTIEAIEQLLPLSNHVPMLLVLVGRTDREHGSWRLKYQAETDYAHRSTIINLTSLGRTELASITRHLLDASDLPEEFQQVIVERSDGNPLFLEEVLRSLIEQKVLAWESDRWRLIKHIESNQIPESLQGILLARIDRLEDDVRLTLQLASVIGRSFLYRILAEIAEAESQLNRHLDTLQRLDLVREKCRQPELEFIFKHALVQSAAYNSLLIERRQEFHRQVAFALEKLFPDRKSEFAGFLAHHYESGGVKDRACEYYQRAGDKARLEYALEEAVLNYQRLAELQAEMGDVEAEARTWLKLGLVRQADFAFDDARQAYDRAFDLQRRKQSEKHDQSKPGRLQSDLRIWRIGGFWSSPPRLDPGKTSLTHEGEIVCALWAGLVEFDLEANVVPHVARSWEVLDGGSRYVFHLRDDVFWTDGNPVTAGDFEWSWKHNLAPGGPEYPSALLDVVKGGRCFRLGENPDPDSVGVRALDDLSLEVRLESPLAYFINLMAQTVALPIPHRCVEEYGDDWWKPPHGVYNGAFKLTEITPGGGSALRNPGYFGDFPGTLDGFRWEIITAYNQESILSRLLEGNLDNCTGFIADEVFARVPKDFEYPHPGLVTQVLAFNPLKSPLDDLRVRKALAHGIDFDRVTDILSRRTGSKHKGGLIPPGMMGHSPELGLVFDLPLAYRYLAEAGYPEGKGCPPLLIGSLKDDLTIQELRRQAQKNLGIELQHVPASPTDFDKLDFLGLHMTYLGWSADYPDPDNFLRQSSFIWLLRSVGWKDAHFDHLVEEAAYSADRARRMALYREADRLLVDEQALCVPTMHNFRLFQDMVHPSIRSLAVDALGNMHYKHLNPGP